MDRRNGGDPLAPPRPPKSLPRVHRPRAQEPPIMSAPNTTTNINIINNNNNNNSSILPHLSPKPQHLLNLTAATTTPTTIRNNNNNNSISLSSSSSSSATLSSPTTAVVPLIAPLTPLHSRNTNSSLILSSNQSISTFSRRRPPATLPISSLTPAIPAATTTTTTSSSNNLDITSSSTTTTLSPVTLASPRPESKRSPNVYVDTPIINRLSPHHQHHHTTANHQLLSSGVTVGPNRQISSVSPSTNLHSNNNNINNNNNNSNSNSVNNNNNNNSNVNSNSGVISQTTNTKAISSSPTTTPTPATTTTTSKTINNNNTISRPNILPLGTTTNNNNNHKQLLPIITKQPVSENSTSKFTSNSASLHEDVDIVHSATTNGDSFNSITCPQCKRCRCEECQRPRQLPSKWLCDNTCLCSAETIIDYASCLCCVKALYYHCSKDHEMERESDTIACADDPCSCLPYKRTTRWGCLGALSLALPCLWCYWPMRGCVSVCANCYAKHSRHGCRCQTNNSRHGNPAVVAGGGGGVVGLGGGAAPGGLSSAASLDVSNSKFNNITNVLQTNTRNINRHHSHKNHHHHHHTNSDDLTTAEKRLELEGVSSGKKYVLAEKSMLLDYSSPE